MRKIFSFIFILSNVFVFGQNAGNNSFSFLNIPTTARSSALGGSSISHRETDPNLVIDNPSVLDTNMDNRFSFNYVNYIADVNAGNFLYAKRIKSLGALSVGLQFLGYGEFTGAAENGQKTGNFKAGDYTLNTGFGKSIDSNWFVGANAKLIYSTYESLQRVGIGVDMSGGYWSDDRLFASNLVIRNMGTSLSKNQLGEREKLPFEIQLGLSKKIARAPLRFHLQFQHLQQWDLVTKDPNFKGRTNKKTGEVKKSAWSIDNYLRHVVLGMDFILHKNFILTAAYNHKRRKELAINGRGSAGLSFGAQLKVKRIQFNYSYASYFVSGNSHHIGISTNLNEYFRKG